MWWVIALVIACFVGIILWNAPVIVQISFFRHDGDDEGEVFVRYLYGLIRMKRSLSGLNTRLTKEGPKLHVQHEGAVDPKKQKEKIISISDVWELIANLPKWMDFFRSIKPIISRFWRKTHVRHINMQLSIGTGDAVFTGLVVGFLFGLSNLAIGALGLHAFIDEVPQIEIQPNFQHSEFQVRFSSIIQVRAGYAISAALRLFFAWKRRISDGASDTRPNADRHGEHSGNGRREHDYRRSG